MSKLIKAIHHVALKCHTLEIFEKTVDFYGNVLRLPVVRKWGEGDDAGIMFDTGAGIVEVFAKADKELPQGTIRHFAFETDSVDKCVEAVKNAGYTVFKGPEDIVMPSEKPYPIRVAFCYGPVGEEVEFFQVRENQ